VSRVLFFESDGFFYFLFGYVCGVVFVLLCNKPSMYFRDCMVFCMKLGCLSLKYVCVCVCVLLGMWVVLCVYM